VNRVDDPATLHDWAALAAAVDKFAIIELCTRPHWIYDHETWDELDDVFTDPVSMPTAEQAAEGAFDPKTYLDSYLVSLSDLKGGMAMFKAGLITQHLVAGHHVALDGDSAVCRAHSINIHFPADNAADDTLLAHGNEYRFDCIRTAAGWRIRGWAPWVRWSYGNQGSHDAASKQSAWLESGPADSR
jgi:hypothetical protein